MRSLIRKLTHHGSSTKQSAVGQARWFAALITTLALCDLLPQPRTGLLAQENAEPNNLSVLEPAGQSSQTPEDSSPADKKDRNSKKSGPKAELAATATQQDSVQVPKLVNKVAVEVTTLRLAAELDGVVDSPTKVEVSLNPKSLKELKLAGLQGHSQRVSRGQLVLQLESAPWERSRRAAEQTVIATEQELKQAHHTLEQLAESSRVELETAELADSRAHEELEHFLREGRKHAVEDLENSINYSKDNLEYVREEYEQLKKMYDADEITEESEEIVLKRALNDLKRAERNLLLTERRVKRALTVELDQQQASLKNSAAKTKLELEKLRHTQDSKSVLAKVAVARAEAAAEAAKQDLANLNEDRQFLSIASPISGIVFWGTAIQSWSGISGVKDLLVIGNNLPTGRALLTVVANEKLYVRTNLPERLLSDIRVGDVAYFEATSQPGSRIELICEEKAELPMEPGNYRTTFRFARPGDSDDLRPFMTGKVTIQLYEKQHALLVPSQAIRYDGANPYVLVYSESSGQSTRQDVVLGKRDGNRVEVNHGLREGEYVVLP